MTAYEKNVALVDALDKVIEEGAVIQGDLIVQVADLDLLALHLKLGLVSVSKLEQQHGRRVEQGPYSERSDRLSPAKLEKQIEKAQAHINQMVNANQPQEAEAGLAKLVLTVVKLIHDLVEREARRRVERGYLTPTELEKLGLNLQAIETKLEELRLVFGLDEDDLNLDLGPLGKLQ